MSLIIREGVRKSWGDTDSVTQPGTDDATEQSYPGPPTPNGNASARRLRKDSACH
ncbi:MAG: hypothetical protein ACYS8X_10295 [Planctomycetota bacterium]|jgi:hypothetical protein